LSIFRANCYFQGKLFPPPSKMRSRTPMIFHLDFRILPLISCSMMVGWSVLGFCLRSHFSFSLFLFLVNCMLCG